MNFQFFIFIFLFQLYNHYILISLYKRSNSEINSIFYLFNNVFQGEIEIRNSQQKKLLHINFAFEYLNFLIYKNLKNYSFNITNSNEEKINLNDLIFIGYNINDNFILQNHKKNVVCNLNFKIYENTSDDFINLNDGYLGLKYIENIDSKKINFFYQLKNKNEIKNYIFFFDFKDKNFIIGDYPHNIFKKYNNNEYNFYEIPSFLLNFKWNIKFLYLQILNIKFYNITAEFSMDTYGIIFPINFFMKIIFLNYF